MRRFKKNDLVVVDSIDKSYSKPIVTSQNSDENIYGPLSLGDEEVIAEVSSDPIVALDLAPGLYNSLAYIELLEQLAKNQIYPKVIVTSGFGLIVASLYAKYQNLNRVNFKMFNLLSKLKNIKTVFSEKWMSEIEKFLNDEFRDERQESYSSLVVIPYYNNDDIELSYTGSLKKNIMRSLKLSDTKRNFLLRPTSFYRRKLSKLGVDLIFNFGVLGQSSKLEIGSGFLLGVFGKLKGYSLQPTNGFKLLEVKNENIDTIKNIGDLIGSVRSESKKVTVEIKNSISEWKNNKR